METIELSAPLLMKTAYLEKTNHSTVSQALLHCCYEYHIDFAKVMLFISDGASYMSKAWKDILCGLWINCNHILCHAHIIALAGTAWRHSLNEVDRCVSQIKSILAKAPARRSRFIRHLESCGVTSPTLPPQPVITRWNSWFEAVVYHSS